MSERIVLIHAAVADSRMWERQIHALRERGLDVVAPDLPGFGSEPVPTEPFSFVDFGRDVRGVGEPRKCECS